MDIGREHRNMTTPIIINFLTVGRVQEFWPLFNQLLKDDFPGYTDTVVNYLLMKMYPAYAFEYWLKTRQKTIIIAETDVKIVGFAVIDSSYGGVSMCRWLGVSKEYRKKGVGRLIFDKWKDLAVRQGCHKIEVAAQENAKDFYEKIGLTLEGKRLNSYFGIDQYIYGLVIGQPNDQAITQA